MPDLIADMASFTCRASANAFADRLMKLGGYHILRRELGDGISSIYYTETGE